jgi:hypothetical protein
MHRIESKEPHPISHKQHLIARRARDYEHFLALPTHYEQQLTSVGIRFVIESAHRCVDIVVRDAGRYGILDNRAAIDRFGISQRRLVITLAVDE